MPVPSFSTVRREIAKLPKYDVVKAQKGMRAADIEFRTTGRGPMTSRPLELTEVDHSPSDLLVIDDDLERWLPLGRSTITGVVDKYSTATLALIDEYSPESSSTVARALRQAILPKTWLRREYPDIQNDWECFGVPEVLGWDNAMHFHSKHLERAALQLGCDIRYGRRDAPWYRAQIEAFLGQVNRSFLHGAPGTTFSNIFDRGDYDPLKNAVIRRSTFRHLLYLWNADVYLQSPNRGINDIPAHRWRNAVQALPPPLPPSVHELETALGERCMRTAFHYGIELFGLRYNSKKLGELRREIGASCELEVNFDRGNIDHVYVLHPRTQQYLRVAAVNFEYARGLTLWQHKVIKRFTVETLRLKTDESGLATAKERIRQLIRHEFEIQKKRTHKAVSRFLEKHQDSAAPSRLPPALFEDVPDDLLPLFEISYAKKAG